MTDIWRQRLAKVFELADIGTERATPHRFRHTFARILLEKGVPLAAVADLMGDTEQVVRHTIAGVGASGRAYQNPQGCLQRQAQAGGVAARARLALFVNFTFTSVGWSPQGVSAPEPKSDTEKMDPRKAVCV